MAPSSPEPSPSNLSPIPAARWSSPGGEYNSPSSASGTVGAVLAHDGSAAPVAISGTFTYRTIVEATFTGSVSRAWNIPGQDPIPDYGPAGPGGNGNGGMVLSGPSGGGAVTSSQGNVSSVTMYIPLIGQYSVSRNGLAQPSHDGPACGPMSTNPYADCITYSGTGGSVSMHPVDVALVGSADQANVTTGTIVKFDVGPSPVDVGGFSVGTDGLEWQWVPDDQTTSAISNPNCGRHCEMFIDYSGTMYARAYTNGTMKMVTVAHIQVTDNLTLKATPTYGPANYRATFTATNSDGAPLYNASWSFKPDSGSGTITPSCGSSNPCAWNVPQSGTMTVTALVHNRYKKATAHVDVVPCPTGDANQDNPKFRKLERMVWDSSHAGDPNQNNRVERAGILIDSAGVKDSIVLLPLNSDPTKNGACGWDATGWSMPSGWTAKALTHSHPFQDGEQELGPGCQGLVYAWLPTSDFASGFDWHVSSITGLPSYIIDFHRVTRIRGDSVDVEPVRDEDGNIITDDNGDPKDYEVTPFLEMGRNTSHFSRDTSCPATRSRAPSNSQWLLPASASQSSDRLRRSLRSTRPPATNGSSLVLEGR